MACVRDDTCDETSAAPTMMTAVGERCDGAPGTVEHNAERSVIRLAYGLLVWRAGFGIHALRECQ